MKNLFICLIAVVIAADSSGLIATVKEKYGGMYADTCSVVSLLDGNFYLTHRDRPTSVFPAGNYSIFNIERVK